MPDTKVSVAEARQNFARLIQRAQRGRAIVVTRRGEPVAVLLSASEYLALRGERPSFVETIERLRAQHRVGELAIGDEDFEQLRDRSAGREVSF